MKRLLYNSLLIAAAVLTSGFFVALSFDEKCKKADLIVRAVVLRTVEFFPQTEGHVRWSPETGQVGSLSPNQKHDPENVHETTSA
jgi:hypothetical protein